MGYGFMPGMFKDFTACNLVAAGCQVEENTIWLVVTKTTETQTWYKPCSDTRLHQAEEDGYLPVPFCSLCGEIQTVSEDGHCNQCNDYLAARSGE